MASPSPRLSICIPTFNRAKRLDAVLGHLFDARPFETGFEVVVCDNASGDETPGVIERWAARTGRVRVFRQRRNVGAFNNILTAYRLARTEYCVYLGDDDRYIPGALDPVVAYMDANPGVAVVHTATEIQDEVTGERYAPHFALDRDHRFGQASTIELLNFVLMRHVFPETFFYRTACIQKIALSASHAYNLFVHLAEILGTGDVAFLQRPYYLGLVSLTGQRRETYSSGEIVGSLDNYQAGLEYLAVKCFRHAGSAPAQIDVLNQLIQSFMGVSLNGAVATQMSTGDWRGAYEFLMRLHARGLVAPGNLDRLAAERQLTERAAAQAFVETFEAMSLLGGVAVAGLADEDALLSHIRERRPQLAVSVLGRDGRGGGANPSRVLVLAGPGADRAALIAAGFAEGLIIDADQLMRQFRF